MQAVRMERRRPADTRWLQHLALLGALGLLLTSVVAGQPQASVQIADQLTGRFLAPPGSPAQEWLPVRVPVRTTITPDPVVAKAPPSADIPVQASASGQIEATLVAAVPRAEWVQAHRRTALYADPDSGAAHDADVPQWSFLQIVESQANWLKVSFKGDGGSRPAGTAWVPASDVGAVTGPFRFVTSVQDTRLWSSDAPDAQQLATVPRLATLELAGATRNGRVAVRLADPNNMDGRVAWVDWDQVAASRALADRDVPLAQAYSPFASEARLDVPYRTQLDGSISSAANCGPTSVSMAIESFGVYVPTAQARALAMRAMGVYDPFGGTTLESLRSVAEANGLQGLDLFENGKYRRWTLDDVRAHLRAGHPVIPELRYRMMPGREWVWVSYDHYVVITGMVGEDFIINDPIGLNGHGERVLTAAQLTRAWMSSDYPGAAVAIARPL
ncbi:MAG: C39 family peptidase [Chloroflexota bacterium]